MTDPAQRIAGFIAAGLAAQKGVDAAVAGACYALTRARLLDVVDALANRQDDRAALSTGAALAELDALGRALRDHFDRLGVRSVELEKAANR